MEFTTITRDRRPSSVLVNLFLMHSRKTSTSSVPFMSLPQLVDVGLPLSVAGKRRRKTRNTGSLEYLVHSGSNGPTPCKVYAGDCPVFRDVIGLMVRRDLLVPLLMRYRVSRLNRWSQLSHRETTYCVDLPFVVLGMWTLYLESSK